MERVVEKPDGSERFIETPLKLWKERLATWKKDHSKPCPMPVGHVVFDNYPAVEV